MTCPECFNKIDVNNMFVCDICGAIFCSQECLSRHLEVFGLDLEDMENKGKLVEKIDGKS